MHRHELRARVQPSLLQDFDAVYDEFVLDEGHGRMRTFVEHLATFSLLPPDVVIELLADVPDTEPPPPDVLHEEITEPVEPPPVVAGADGPAESADTVESAEDAPGADDVSGAPGRPHDEDDPSSPDAVTEAPPSDDEPSSEEVSPATARTSDDVEEPEGADSEPTLPSEIATAPPDAEPAPVVTPPGFDSSAETVRLPTREALLAAEEAAAAVAEEKRAASDTPEVDAAAATQERPRPTGAADKTTVNLERPDLGTLLDGDSDSDEWEDVPDDDEGHKRTMFRKMTGGALRETGRFGEAEEPPRRRRRRRRRLPKGDEHYAFEGTVGEGAMGRVLLARDRKLHRPVAYKAMSEELLKQPTLASKFSAEARITAQLDHPAIVPVYTLESDTAYTMKLIEGDTLEQVFDRIRSAYADKKPVPDDLGLERRIEMFLRVCEAVSYAHSRGVIHRDLKPENIMVGQWGEVFVMDWGIAKVFDASVEHPVDLGMEPDDEGELIIGTAGYMSPEQAEGWNTELDGASDQYALGLILFELVSLRAAVTGKVPLKMVMRHQDGEKDPLVHIAGKRLPRELVAIIHKATAKDIARRYPSVRALAEDLRRYLRGEPVVARPDGPLQALSRWMGRHRELTLFVVTSAFLGLFLLVGVVGAYGQIQLARAQAREQRVSNLLTTAARQASQLDGQFLKMEGLLSVVSTAASEALLRPASADSRVYLSSDFERPALAPPDADIPRDHAKYGERLVSTIEPVFVGGREVSPAMLRLGDMGRHFQKVLLRSHSEKRAAINPAMARRTIVDVEIPVSWAFVALDDGLLVSFPGHGGWPDGADATDRPWYVSAADQQTPVWSGVSPHPAMPDRRVLTVSQALFDTADNPVGVSGLHLSLVRLLDGMTPEELRDADIETMLLDQQGNVVVHSDLATDPTLALGEAFTVPEVVRAISEHQSGLHWVGRDEIVAYNRLTSNGWTYVMRGDAGTLLQ